LYGALCRRIQQRFVAWNALDRIHYAFRATMRAISARPFLLLHALLRSNDFRSAITKGIPVLISEDLFTNTWALNGNGGYFVCGNSISILFIFGITLLQAVLL